MAIRFGILTFLFTVFMAQLSAGSGLIGIKDSVGNENADGKLVILHKVVAGETLYSLARLYKANVADIKTANPNAASGLKLGEILRIPTQRNFLTVSSNAPLADKTHTVAQGEGLFSIAKKYGLTIDELKSLNNLSDNNLSVGQELKVGKPTTNAANKNEPKVTGAKKIHIVEKGQTLYSVAVMYGQTMANLRELNNLTTDELKPGQKIVVGEIKVTTGVPVAPPGRFATPNFNKQDTAVGQSGFETIAEFGFATLIEGNQSSRKHLALHRTAPVGTILQIKNELNGAIVFVRVIGKLPEIGANQNLLVRISSKAYERLGAIDKKIPVVVSYPKP